MAQVLHISLYFFKKSRGVMSSCASVCHLCTVSTEARREHQIFDWSHMVVNCQVGTGNPSSCPVKSSKQESVLLKAEPSLQTLLFFKVVHKRLA